MSRTRTRRTHSAAFKARLVAQCRKPGVSIAAVATAHQINNSLLRKWLRLSAGRLTAPACTPATAEATRMIPVQVAAPVEQSASTIRLHIQRGSTQVQVEWPIAAAALCSDWVRAVLS